MASGSLNVLISRATRFFRGLPRLASTPMNLLQLPNLIDPEGKRESVGWNRRPYGA